MNLILLGGVNPATEQWAKQVEASVKGDFESTQVMPYLHWQNGGEMNLNAEASRLGERASELDRYMIFAKSAGTLVTLKAIHEGLILPDKCVFVGVPLRFAEGNDLPLNDWAEGYDTPTLFAQNAGDPMGGFDDLRGFLEDRGVENNVMSRLPDDDHDYSDIAKLSQLVTGFANRP